MLIVVARTSKSTLLVSLWVQASISENIAPSRPTMVSGPPQPSAYSGVCISEHCKYPDYDCLLSWVHAGVAEY